MALKMKRSAVAGKVPTTGQLDLGELAVNTYDGKLYLKRDDGAQSIQRLANAGQDESFENLSARKLTFDNLEKSGLSDDGDLGFDASQGLILYRTQQGVDGAVTVLDGANIEAGDGIAITNTGLGGTGTQKFTFSAALGLPALNPGSAIRSRIDAQVSRHSTSYTTQHVFSFLQTGTIRVSLELKCSDAASPGDVRIRRLRNASWTTVANWTPTTSWLTKTADVAVKLGDKVEVQYKGGGTAMRRLLRGEACVHKIETVIPEAARDGWPLAYAIAWISVAGGDSVMPPWVRHQFPEASRLVRRLRDTPCTDPDCDWCREQNDPNALLKRWFGFEGFRPNPVGPDGKPLQETIVATALGKSPILGILPTGTGKSVCYQLPALSQFTKTGALTVVISPLVALMADQVEGMRRQGITSCVTINGMLSMPERQEALNQVRLGDAAMLLISPEQLRSPSVRSVLNQREVGYWVLDEAHCVSKWGHDFRPDYRYVGRFIKEFSGDEDPAPIICLTATAKPDVIQDITDHFKTKLSVILKLLDGGAVRENLSFEIIPTDKGRKLGDVVTVLQDALPKSGKSGAIVYCSTRSATERIAAFLKERGFAAAHYHAGLKPEEKHDVQMAFADGALRVIAATNAFGMGIDKPDIRLVVHADIPGSLENYLQEAGRAGRDREHARGVEDFVREIGDRETDRRDILEWLAEWGRGVRKRQSGLLLLSAHRAKGLEFDHVVVLDGAWEKRSNGEDKDAARRLYYVAMTRARRSLALTTMTDKHPILENLNDEAFLIRRCAPGTVEVSDCRKLYKTLDLSEVFLDFAGRLHEGNASLAALERIKSDDPLLLEERGDHWVVTDRDGTAVCRLAKKFAPPAGAKFLHGNAYAISTRFREDSAEQYQSHLKRDTWRVVLPELVFGSSSVAHVREGANESKQTWAPSIFKGTGQEQASIEPEVAEGSGGRLRADNQFILELTEDQKHILNAIEDNDDGISFSELCAKTGFSAAKVQGDLGAITNKSRKIFGERFVFLNKRNGRYYPHGSILPVPEAASEVSTYHERIEKVKKKSPNAYAAWDEDQEVELRDLFERQISIAEIARTMGRQPGGIRSRLKKIGLIDKKHAKRAPQDASAKILPDEEYQVIEIEEKLDTEIICDECGEVIPELRLKAAPGTSKCVDCASKRPFEKRQIKEPWGTREEFNKDRWSWIPWRKK